MLVVKILENVGRKSNRVDIGVVLEQYGCIPDSLKHHKMVSAEIQQKMGKRFINQALYIKSLNHSVSTCMNKTVATYLKGLHTRVKGSIQ